MSAPKAWGGRFGESAGRLVEEFTSSISFDKRLWRYDILGSIAHARMLANTGIIAEEEAAAIIEGLKTVWNEIEEGKFEFRTEYEDIHLNIERRLIELIGPVGGKLHAARSRNDQVSLDVHMFVKDEIDEVIGLIRDLQATIVSLASSHMGVVMPGFTHTQRAQPVLFSNHMMAYFWMFQRDIERLSDCRKRADRSPLGACALAGTTFPIDPKQTAEELGFAHIYENGIDAVSDRDYIMEFLFALTLVAVHLSRLAGEIVLWSSVEFGFIELDDAVATGSSIMPQKKNPDVAELVRGKTGRVLGDLVNVITMMKGLPLAYNSDMQEDKEPLFDAVDTVKKCLGAIQLTVSTMKVKKEAMERACEQGFLLATELADYLTRKGVPFREAHRAVGSLVKQCIESGKELRDVTVDDLRSANPEFGEDALLCLDPSRAVKLRTGRLGTSPEVVRAQIEEARRLLAGQDNLTH
ncbi:MAG TPA: argininosuccinate lyase [Clostridia bacterium]|nr:argininosuccinate lyase [Clostridia bacterium]